MGLSKVGGAARRILAAVFVFTLALVPGSSRLAMADPAGYADANARRLFEEAAAKGHIFDNKPLNQALREAGEPVIPFLAKKLESGGEEAQLAADGLVYVGGRKAVDALMDRYSRHGEKWVKKALCQAMASTGNVQDNKFLVETISHWDKEDPFTLDATVISLGLLRNKAALENLKKVGHFWLNSDTEMFTKEAIDRITKPPLVISGLTMSKEQDRVIAALVENMMDSMTRSPVFYEGQNNRTWKKNCCAWIVTPGIAPMSDRPRIRFDVFVTSDGNRALAEVSFSFGLFDGVGYDYLLEKRKGKWIVTGEILKWVS